MAYLLDVEIEFWSPCSWIVLLKEKRLQSWIFFFLFNHEIGSSASVGSVSPDYSVKVHQPQMCIHLSVDFKETPHKDIDSLPPPTSQKAEQCIVCYI